MKKPTQDELLAKLASLGVSSATATAVEPAPVDPFRPAERAQANGNGHGNGDARLDKLLDRISSLAGDACVVKRPAARPRSADSPARDQADTQTTAESTAPSAPAKQVASGPFLPLEPDTFAKAGVTEGQVESLLLKYLLGISSTTGRDAADQIKLPFKLIDELMTQMKQDRLVFYYADAPMNDYVYQLTDLGRERARRMTEECSYYGACPVPLDEYVSSVAAQTLTDQRPTLLDLKRAFDDLLINQRMLHRLGPAINSGRGLFLFGPPGNGKTSIAERVTAAFGSEIWIPRAIHVDGQIIRVFDPLNHQRVTRPANEGLIDANKIDRRWVRIKRPTIIAGGELTMDNLEVTLNTTTGVCEAPLQLKSNCGTLVIDDFGRQKMSIDTLLNRWIVPLEKRYDFLNMPNGKKIRVPFDQLIIFSTNLEPRDLVDDAFLRRIPYKVEVVDPSEEEFRDLFKLMAPKLGLEYKGEVVEYVIDTHYKKVKRPFRCCQPRDLLMQVRNYCNFVEKPPEMTTEYFDYAVENYFAVM